MRYILIKSSRGDGLLFHSGYFEYKSLDGLSQLRVILIDLLVIIKHILDLLESPFPAGSCHVALLIQSPYYVS